MKTIRILVLLFVVFGCNSNTNQSDHESIKSDTTSQNTTEPEVMIQDSTELGKKWLISSIEGYFKDFDKLNGDFSKICTKDYAEYKSDATGVAYDGGLTEAEFKTKWKNRNLKFAGIGEGFLIGGNDFGTIKVVKCDFKNKNPNGSLVFEAVIEDQDFKSKFYRDIVIIPSNNGFLIDDVLEIENEFGGE